MFEQQLWERCKRHGGDGNPLSCPHCHSAAVAMARHSGMSDGEIKEMLGPDRKHSHYFKPCPFDHVDIYRVLVLFNVTDPCLQHAVKKIMVAGGRGGGKDISKDVQEAIDTLARWQEMRKEEGGAA